MIQNIKNLLNIPFVRNTLKLSSSHVALVFLPLLVTPILSRLYSPGDYGDWGVFSSVFYIVNAILFLSYENTIVKSNNKDEIPNLVVLCLIVTTCVVILLFSVFLGGRFLKIKFFSEFPSLLLLVVILFAQALHTICNCLANREKKYGVMSVAGVVSGVSQASFRILFGVLPIVAYGLIVGNVLAQLLTTFFILYCLRNLLNLSFWKKVSFRQVKSLAIKNKKFPFYDAPARLIEFSIGNLALIILTFYWGKETIGCYSMVIQFILLPIAIIGSAMGNVFYREISENIHNEKIVVASTRRAGKISFALSFLPALFLSLGGDKLLVLFLGDKWETAGLIALCLSIQSIPIILSEPLLPVFRSLDRQELRFKLNVLNLVLSLGVLIIMANVTSNIYIVLIIYSLACAFVRYFMFFYVIHLTNVKAQMICRYFYLSNIVCLLCVGIRLFFELF